MPPKRKEGGRKKHLKPYIAPKPKKPKIWARVATGLAMLRYRPEIREIRQTALARRIKNPSACIVAPVFAAVEKFKDWSTQLVENVFEIGNELHRITLQQLKLRANSCYPLQCVSPTFMVNLNKVSILVRPTSIPNTLQGGVSSSIENDQVKSFDKLLAENHGVLLQCSGRTFAFWKDRGKFFALIPEGFASPENYMPVLLKSNDLRSMLEHSLQLEHGTCNLFSLKVLSKLRVPMSLRNVNAEFIVPEVRESDLVLESPPAPPEVVVEQPEPPAEAGRPKKDAKKKVEEEPEDTTLTEDVILQYTADYKEIDENRGILIGKLFCDDPDRILHTIVSAALFLQHVPANLWTTTIITDIMNFGKKIFYLSESEDLLDNEDWLDRILFPIRFMKKDYSATFEKIVFGKVTSTDREVLTVEQGLRSFFEGNDTGILIGPQIVLVWQHKSNYFMFDPKERDAVGRKFTRMFSSQIGQTDIVGAACVTWFRSLKKMAEVYTDTITLKHRKDTYRIIRMKVYQANTGLVSQGEWFAIAPNRWLVVGTKTLCDYSYADDKWRPGKAICMAISALISAMEKPEPDWDAAVIDNILAEGIELFKQSLAVHAQEKPFLIANVKKIFDISGRRVRLYITECAIKGPMLGEPKGTNVPLKAGLVNFFDAARYGLFNVKDVTLAVWRGEDSYYYLFYPYEKLLGLPPQCLCASDANLPPMGLANSMRFKTVMEMFDFMSTSLNTKEMDEYCLSPLDIFLSEAGGRPPLYEYDAFREGGAIMRPYKNLHEGHEMYGVRADKQTLANLLVALGFNRINPAGKWTKEDMVDILNIGDKIFCKIYMGLIECRARDYQLQWEDVTPVIGMNKFTFTREPMIGVIEIQPEPISEEMEGEGEGLDEDNEEGVEQQDDELFVRPEGGYVDEPKLNNDLKGILQQWENKKKEYHEAIIETDFFTIAVWKREDLYFIFDPKASGDNGELTERRMEVGKDRATGDNFSVEGGEEDENKKEDRPLYLEKRNYQSFENEGSAYTAWFSTFDEFFEHIFAITPPDYRYGKMTLHDLTITNTPVVSVDFGIATKATFRNINAQHAILRGSMTMGNPSLTNRNKQEFTNAIVAMAFARITPSSQMTTTLLDVILKYGDRLYSKSMNALKKTDMNKFCSLEKVTVNEIAPVFSIYKIRFNWRVAGINRGNCNVAELKKAVGRLGSIEAGSAIIFVHKGYTMGFWKGDGNAFYLYDPFETNPNGQITENGLPSLSKFSKLDSILNYLVQKFVCVSGPNNFVMYQIKIASAPIEDLRLEGAEGEEDPEKSKVLASLPKTAESFQPYQGDMRILKSALGPEKTSDHSLAIAAVVHSRLQFVGLWNFNVGQRITCLSKYILQKTECELGLAPHSYDDIRCSFAVDNEVLCHIVFGKAVQGPICSTKRTELVGVNLKNAITLFFKSCQNVLITLPTDGTSYALWRDNAKYYLFGIDHIHSEIYVVSAATLPPLYEVVMRGAHAEDDKHNWYELRTVTVTTVPIKEAICKPLRLASKLPESVMSTQPGDYFTAESKDAHYFDHITAKPELIKTEAHKFVPVGRGVEILHSRGLIRTHRFFGTKDFFPSLKAACVEASALSQVKSPSLWTKKTLEKLLTAGINLYINTVAVKGVSQLQMVDFKGNLFVANYELEVCPLTPTVQAASKEDLQMCLTWVLRKYQTAYLYTQNFCFTLILENNDCFLYFPGSNESLCDGIQSDCSCLIKFCTISDLLDRVLTNAKIARCENVYIGPICVFRH